MFGIDQIARLAAEEARKTDGSVGTSPGRKVPLSITSVKEKVSGPFVFPPFAAFVVNSTAYRLLIAV